MKLNENNEGTQRFTPEEILAYGEGTIFRGAPDTGFAGGPSVSPQFGEALAHSGSAVDRGTGGSGPRPEMATPSPAGADTSIRALFTKEG